MNVTYICVQHNLEELLNITVTTDRDQDVGENTIWNGKTPRVENLLFNEKQS